MTDLVSGYDQEQKPAISFMSMTMVTALMCGWLYCPAEAAEWSGKGELGVVIARGNSETETINLGFEVLRESEIWRNELGLSALRNQDGGELAASRYTMRYKSDYKFDETRYIFGALRYDRDRFSSYRYQGTFSIGYGHQLIDTDTQRLRVEVGPGVRWTEERESGRSETDPIGRASVNYRLNVSDNAEFTNRFLVETGTSNTFAENSSALEVAINDQLALKVSLAVRHNTDVDPGRKNTDTLTTANIVYNFL